METIQMWQSCSTNITYTNVHILTIPSSSVIQGEQEGLAVASIVRDDPSTLPSDDPSPRACMHCDHNAW